MAGNIVIESTSVASAKNEDAVTEGSKYQSVSTEKCKRYVQITILGEDKGQTEDGKIIIQQIFTLSYSILGGILRRQFYVFFTNDDGTRTQLEINQHRLRASQVISNPSIINFTGPDTGLKISNDSDTHYLRARRFFPSQRSLTTGHQSSVNSTFSVSFQSLTGSGILARIQMVNWPYLYIRYDSNSNVAITDSLNSHVSGASYDFELVPVQAIQLHILDNASTTEVSADHVHTEIAADHDHEYK